MDWQSLVQAIEGRQDISKAAVSATGIAIGGAVTPAAARKYFTTVRDESKYLGIFSSQMVDAIEQDVDLLNVASRQLQRVAEGTEPSTITGANNLGKRWALKAVQLFPTINFSTLIQRQKQGNIESYLVALFAKIFRNDILDLGLNGDESSGTAFLALNDGWVELSKDGATGAKDMDTKKAQRLSHGTVTSGPYIVGETITGGTSAATGVVAVVGTNYLDLVSVVGTFAGTETLTGGTSSATSALSVIGAITVDHIATYDALIAAQDDKYLIEGTTAFLCSRKNAIKWGKEMGLYTGLNPYLVTGQPPEYEGFPVIGIPGFPADTFVMTDPKNWAWGMGSQPKRFRNVNGRKRCIEYTWDLYCDYIVLNDLALTYAD